jgi:hypothetical protein
VGFWHSPIPIYAATRAVITGAVTSFHFQYHDAGKYCTVLSQYNTGIRIFGCQVIYFYRENSEEHSNGNNPVNLIFCFPLKPGNDYKFTCFSSWTSHKSFTLTGAAILNTHLFHHYLYHYLHLHYHSIHIQS